MAIEIVDLAFANLPTAIGTVSQSLIPELQGRLPSQVRNAPEQQALQETCPGSGCSR